MAFSSLRLRRALTLSSSLLTNIRSFSSSSSSVLQSHISSLSSANVIQNPRNYLKFQSLSFHSSLPSSSSRSYNNNNNDDDKISPDTILFEGCDYNHWLITMDFPKDPRPTPEEMVETYVQTLAKVVGSVEEAKKRMYACSTTTYNGFQAVMTEEMSEKFKGLAGVVFILPDSYIDPVNKEYGGDKYINGTIIPRPPPVQYGRQGRYGDRNRDRPPRFDRQRDPMPMQQGSQPNDSQGSIQGDGRNYGAQQGYTPQQNYGPTGQGERRDFVPMGGSGYTSGERRDPMPSYQREYNQGNQGNYPSQEQRDLTQGYRGVTTSPTGGYGQGADSGYRQSYPATGEAQRFQQNGMQEKQGVIAPPTGGYGQGADSGYRQGYPGTGEAQRFQQNGMQERQGVTPPPSGGYGQAADSGYRQSYPGPPPSGGYGQGADSGYRQGYPGPGETQRFPQVPVQQSSMPEGQGSYMPMGQDKSAQGQY